MKISVNNNGQIVDIKDNTFVANAAGNVGAGNVFLFYFVDSNGDVYRNTEISYGEIAVKRSDGMNIGHLLAIPFESDEGWCWKYTITETDGVLYAAGQLSVSAHFVKTTLTEGVITKRETIATVSVTAHVQNNIGLADEDTFNTTLENAMLDRNTLQAEITQNVNDIADLETDKLEVSTYNANRQTDNSTRDAQDNALGARIDAETSARQQADNTLTAAVATANATANAAVSTANNAKSIAEGREKAGTYSTVALAVSGLNAAADTDYKVGDNVYIVTTDVPDLWIAGVAETSVPYEYTTDEAFTEAFADNGTLQIGYYTCARLESGATVKPTYIEAFARTGATELASDWLSLTGADGTALTPKVGEQYCVLNGDNADELYRWNAVAYVPLSTQIQSDWGQTDNTAVDFIKNKPTNLPVTYFKENDVLQVENWKTEVWTASTLPEYGDWTAIAYGQGLFVAITPGGKIATSPTGTYWEILGTQLPANPSWWRSLIYADGRFFALASEGNYAYSNDGINWTLSSIPTTTGAWKAVAYGNGKYVAIGGAYNNAQKVAYSTDCLNWTEIDIQGAINNAIAFGDNVFVIGPTPAYSYDGINWTTTSFPAPFTANSILYGNGKFVAIAGGRYHSYTESDSVMYSTDGINWTEATLPERGEYCSIAYGDGKFAIVSRSRQLFSEDGIIWVRSTINSTSGYSDLPYIVGYGSNKFVEIAENKLRYWSPENYELTTFINILTIESLENTAIKVSMNSASEIKSGGKHNSGMLYFTRETIPTADIPITIEGFATSIDGLIEIINSYKPTIPEAQTNLPVTASKLSGSIAVTDWVGDYWNTLMQGNIDMPLNVFTLICHTESVITEDSQFKLTYNSPNHGIIECASGTAIVFSNYILFTSWTPNMYGFNFRVYTGAEGNFVAGDIAVQFTNDGISVNKLQLYDSSNASSYSYTLSNAAIKENSIACLLINDSNTILVDSKADGTIVVKVPSLPSEPVPYTLQIADTSTEGVFEVINSYKPTKTSELTNDSGFVSSVGDEQITLATTDWTADSTIEPFAFKASKTLTQVTGLNDNCTLSLSIDAVTQAKYGIVIGTVVGQVVTLYAVTAPTASVTATIMVEG